MPAQATFGETHFGQAALGDPRRTRRWVRLADQIDRHPGGTLPAKLHQPKDYKAMDRLRNRPAVTPATVLETHRQHTLAPRRPTDHVVLVLHDTTELDYSGLRSITDLGPIGGGHTRGLLCHNSLAFDPHRLSIHDFFYALARLGGHQNRTGNHRPGWRVRWRGWMALPHRVEGADALKTCGQT